MSEVEAVPPISVVRIGDDLLDGGDDRGGGLAVTEMVEHHGSRPDLPDRVGDSLARDIGRRSVHRFEHRGVVALGVDVGRRRDANAAGHRRPEIGKNVAKQIRANDHIEPIWMLDKVGGEDVDMKLVGRDVGIAARDLVEPFVPVRHRVNDTVRLGCRREVAFGPALCELEGIGENAVDAVPRED